MRGHNICFYAELTKIIPNYHLILPLIYSSAVYIKFQNDYNKNRHGLEHEDKGLATTAISKDSDQLIHLGPVVQN